ncbi:tetratricopeptide repeat protein [Undibacterium squillarum]|uniref:tetratricopeptide repeat protein n=1 Tax=Undibacterium squillarum TaxID=1131567 RepID=UPI0035B17521
MSARLLICLLFSVLTGCATQTKVAQPALFHDAAFALSRSEPRAEDVLKVSEPMREFLKQHVRAGNGDMRVRLYQALKKNSGLMLEYDAEETLNASEAFDRKSGNCLSLVLMTAAMARELGLDVRFQNVRMDDSWTRTDHILLASGHVNVLLGQRTSAFDLDLGDHASLIIDFLPPGVAMRQQADIISEKRIVAMYFNNRAAELLARGKAGEAYWYAKAAITTDPDFSIAINTLGVVYRKQAMFAEAEQLFRYIVVTQPENVVALSNLQELLVTRQRHTEAAAVATQLAKLQPEPPFYFLNQGKQAYQEGRFADARKLIEKELRKDPYNEESYFWLARTYFQLGNLQKTDENLQMAEKNALTRKSQDLYYKKRQSLALLAQK